MVHDPAGELLREPTNVAWGGAERRDLYVGSIGVDYVLKTRSPVAGQAQVHQFE
jgi:gluconolactonase